MCGWNNTDSVRRMRGVSRLFWALLAAFSGCTSTIYAPSLERHAVVEDAAGNHTPGPFWELRQSADAPPRMYFLGSIHAASGDMFPLAPVIEQAYERSEGLVVEINLLAIDPEETQRLVALHGLLLGEETLEDMLPPEMLDRLRQDLERRGMSWQSVERIRPWMVATMLEEAQLAELGYEFAHGIDLHFLRRAVQDKEVVALETFESQLAMLSMLPPQLELRFLQDILSDPQEVRNKMQQLMSAWQRGDEATLETVIFEHMDDDPHLAELYDRLIFRRNVSMADELERLLEQPGTWFVVVGAGHFVGDRSVIARMKQKGYDIRRVP